MKARKVSAIGVAVVTAGLLFSTSFGVEAACKPPSSVNGTPGAQAPARDCDCDDTDYCDKKKAPGFISGILEFFGLS